MNVKTGFEVLMEGRFRLKNVPFGLLANQASVTCTFLHSKQCLFQAYPEKMRRLFSPQHGFRGEKQDNMIESPFHTDMQTGLPVHSLYGARRCPAPEWLDDLEILLVDLQDVGTRVYTFIHTMALAMKACRECGKSVIVLDRPNPLGGLLIQGNLLEPDWASFVGMYPIPMRHGLTIGEMALFLNEEFAIRADLTVVPMEGWERRLLWPDTGRPFIPPSPNMPIFETAQVYPGQVIWEATNISEGRGTCRPFEMFGAPFIRPSETAVKFKSRGIPGVFLREIAFEPVFHKWTGELCNGFHVHITVPEEADPYYVSLCLLQDLLELYPEHFQWKYPPYEYEYDRMPIDLILGSHSLRKGLEAGADLSQEKEIWEEQVARFRKRVQPYLLYS